MHLVKSEKRILFTSSSQTYQTSRILSVPLLLVPITSRLQSVANSSSYQVFILSLVHPGVSVLSVPGCTGLCRAVQEGAWEACLNYMK